MSNERCYICLKGIDQSVSEDEGNEKFTLPCQHRFHRQCIAFWAMKNPSCPQQGCLTKFSPFLLANQASNCSVCMSPLQQTLEGDSLPPDEAALLPCFHDFHLSCIMQWSSRSNTCPLCQRRFDAVYTASTTIPIETTEARHIGLPEVLPFDSSDEYDEESSNLSDFIDDDEDDSDLSDFIDDECEEADGSEGDGSEDYGSEDYGFRVDQTENDGTDIENDRSELSDLNYDGEITEFSEAE